MANKKDSDPELEIKAKLSNADEWKTWHKSKNKKAAASHGTSGALFFFGFVGSLVYWMQAANDFGAVLTGILKSLVWPAYIVYKLLESFYGVVN